MIIEQPAHRQYSAPAADAGRRRLQVIIVGAGFGGLTAVRALKRATVDITLVDRRNHHLSQPLLYQVAAAGLSPAEIAWPIRRLFRRQPNVRVLLGEVTGVDRERKLVRIGARSLLYDMLIVATGASHAYFGHDGWAPHAPGLKSVEDATEIRLRILLAFERAEMESDPAERCRLLTPRWRGMPMVSLCRALSRWPSRRVPMSHGTPQRAAGKAEPRPFRYHDSGLLATIGRRAAGRSSPPRPGDHSDRKADNDFPFQMSPVEPIRASGDVIDRLTHEQRSSSRTRP